MLNLVARRYRISGRVQGVGFRYFAERRARQWSISGWVRNLPDDTVEVHAEGDPERLQHFEQDLRNGPPHARVDGFESSEAAVAGIRGFEIR